MNRDRWKNAPTSRLIAKLTEETGEVAKAYLNVLDATSDDQRAHRKLQMAKEIGHATFILDTLISRIELGPGPFDMTEEDANGS